MGRNLERSPRRRHAAHIMVITHLVVAFSAFNMGVSWGRGRNGMYKNSSTWAFEFDKSLELQRMKLDFQMIKRCPPCPPRVGNKSYPMIQTSISANNESIVGEKSKNNPSGEITMNTTSVKGMSGISRPQRRLPPTFGNLFVGMSRVSRDEFIRMFDVGVPFQQSEYGNQEVLILHSPSSLPAGYDDWNATSPAGPFPVLSTAQATKSCLTMKMILESPQENHCLAIVGQHESHIMHKWMRIAEGNSVASLQTPWRMVSRSNQRDNWSVEYPTGAGMKESFDFISNYAAGMEASLNVLRPLAARVGAKNNTIIVMVCNYGQVELLINFVCSARSRGLDISQILLFATDSETQIVAQNMGISAFYDEKIFGQLPKEAAESFGDMTFMNLIMAKVHCIHLISQLEYNIVYQDVDTIWFRHPLDYFSSTTLGDFDIYFQDNMSRHSYGEPYHANLGFFYARFNRRTSFFFTSLVRRGDLVLTLDEQVTVNIMLGEHASFTGLKSKVLSGDNFPGGWHFHRAPDYMKDLMQGKILPYIFHMSWTADKKEKLQYLEQLGYLFLSGNCTNEITSNRSTVNASSALSMACCVATPIAKCSFRDKPSRIPCNHTKPKDEGKPSFW